MKRNLNPRNTTNQKKKIIFEFFLALSFEVLLLFTLVEIILFLSLNFVISYIQFLFFAIHQYNYVTVLFHFCRYIFKNQKKAGLQELGPRFTLKLRSLQRGSFDSKFGEYEWIHKVCSTELLVLSITLGLCSHLWVPKYDSHWPLM